MDGIDRLDTSQGVVVLVDLFGGTPCNAAALGARERLFPIVSGANLPMLLEILLNRECGLSVEELVDLTLEAGRASIVDVSAKLKIKRQTAEL
jgi:mannose/fructose-specific phosphotransferase system component IIA